MTMMTVIFISTRREDLNSMVFFGSITVEQITLTFCLGSHVNTRIQYHVIIVCVATILIFDRTTDRIVISIQAIVVAIFLYL
jgi:hypothetical protein